jgi:hypothetical protein
MRKNIGIWATAVATVLSLQQVSSAQSRITGGDLGSRTRTSVRLLEALEEQGTRSKLELGSAYDDESAAGIELVGAEGDKAAPPPPAENGPIPAPDPGPAGAACGSGQACAPVCCVECPEFWEHRCAVWGEFLFLKPRGADITYATAVNGTISTAVPIANKSVAGFNYDPGFKVGGSWALDSCSSFTGNFMWFRGETSDDITLGGGGGAFIRAETVHPGTINVAADSLAAHAEYDIDMQAMDFNYKSVIWGGSDYAFNYLVGIRYSRLDQQFEGRYSILGTTTVNTNVDFDGVGPRFGYEGERELGGGLIVYSKGAVNFLVGNVRADYLQQNVFTGIQAQTGLRDSRIVTVPEFEIGAGWQSCNGCFRLTAGYYIAAWVNMMTTPEYLSIVRVTQNSFERQEETLTFDGLTVRAEVRF